MSTRQNLIKSIIIYIFYIIFRGTSRTKIRCPIFHKKYSSYFVPSIKTAYQISTFLHFYCAQKITHFYLIGTNLSFQLASYRFGKVFHRILQKYLRNIRKYSENLEKQVPKYSKKKSMQFYSYLFKIVRYMLLYNKIYKFTLCFADFFELVKITDICYIRE